jgi:hypothetical protein
MKKIFVIMLALVLAAPALSYAGSATSRWDLTIGGKIVIDFGFDDDGSRGTLSGSGIPNRDVHRHFESVAEKFGTSLWGAGQTQLTFGVRGPDAWGAKTGAFILTDFSGTWGTSTTTQVIPAPGTAAPTVLVGNGQYDTLDLMVAQITLDWPDTQLLIGQTGGVFGAYPPTFAESVGYTLHWGGKGAAPTAPQITVTQRFMKDWTAKFGIMSPQNTTSALNSLGPNFGGSTFTRLRGPACRASSSTRAMPAARSVRGS